MGGFNSGLMVIEPRPGRAADIFARMPELGAWATIAGDQDLLNWHHADWPSRRQLHLDDGDNMRFTALDEHVRGHDYRLGAGGKPVRVVHFVCARKPWGYDARKRLSALARPFALGRWSEARVLHGYLRDLAQAEQAIISGRERRTGLGRVISADSA